MRKLDLSLLSVPQLKAIRAILTDGAIASAETKSAKRLREAEAELTKLKTLQSRWQMIADAGLTDLFNHGDEDNKYILSHSDKHFNTLLRNLLWAKEQAKLAEATKGILKVPQIPRAEELSSIEIVRKYFTERKNGYYE